MRPSSFQLAGGSETEEEGRTDHPHRAEIIDGLLRFSVLPLPRSLLANLCGHALGELAIATDHEDVAVVDGAEGLVAHAGILRSSEALMLINAPTRAIVAARMSQTLAERTAGSAFAPVPLKQLLIAFAQRTARKCIEARTL